MRMLLALVLVAAGFGGGYLFHARKGAGAAQTGGRKVLYWVDPMHPAYKSDKPGIAPDCGMKLEPVYADDGPAPDPNRRILYYRDPQDPSYTAENPGLNPETGNDLVPVYEGDPASMPPGTVQISPEKQQLIGVRYGTAEYTAEQRTVRAPGRVAYDETRISRVHSRTEGWVERLYVDFTGKFVRRDEPLLALYSPELLASQQELLLAARARETMQASTLPSAFKHSESLLAAARRRLELWELSEAQIAQVIETGKPIRSVTLYAPASGYVLERNVFPNQKIAPETQLYTIADLSRVWVMADIFEQDAPLITAGRHARVSLPYPGGRSFPARVDYVQPRVDAATRTLQVRLEMNNPGLLLKPDMYVEVEFHVGLPRTLTVPVEAVLDSGDRETVFVDRGNGFLEPRRVETGARAGGRVAILSGLKAGERVVTSGNFLIDSESQLKAAADGMGAPDAPADAGHGSGHQHD